jgi:hypothetical protein
MNRVRPLYPSYRQPLIENCLLLGSTFVVYGLAILLFPSLIFLALFMSFICLPIEVIWLLKALLKGQFQWAGIYALASVGIGYLDWCIATSYTNSNGDFFIL